MTQLIKSIAMVVIAPTATALTYMQESQFDAALENLFYYKAFG